MQDTVNFLTEDDSLADNGAAWTAAIAGPRSTSSFFEVLDGEAEYAIKPTATAPVVAFRGHRIKVGESQNLETMPADKTLYLRAKAGNVEIVATPGDA